MSRRSLPPGEIRGRGEERADPQGDSAAAVPLAVSAARSQGLMGALGTSRAALMDIEAQLDALLSALRAPSGRPPSDAADRLRRASKWAGAAVARLAEV